MTNSTPTQKAPDQSVDATTSPPTILRCLTGSLIAGAIASGSYFLTSSIASTFADKPIHSSNITVINLASAVRTLVVGVSALATAVFSLAAFGLAALAIQILIQRMMGQKDVPTSETKS